eukprot:gene22948-27756_t
MDDDCEEPPFYMLYRRYGEEETEAVLRDLQLVWISHIHADHHAGLPSVLVARRKALQAAGNPSPPPLLVIGPWPLHGYLKAWNEIEDLCFMFADCRESAVGGMEARAGRFAGNA